MKKLFILLCLLLLTGLGYCVYHIFQPQDLTDIEGYDENDRHYRPIDLPSLIERAAKNKEEIEITERQINTWLSANLKMRQEGILAGYVDLKGVWVRFEGGDPSRCEIIVEREYEGQKHTLSMYLRIVRKDKGEGAYSTLILKDGGKILGLIPVGGRFGEVRMPQGFLLLVSDTFLSLSKLFEQELQWLQEDITRRGAGHIFFEEHKMRIVFPKLSEGAVLR